MTLPLLNIVILVLALARLTRLVTFDFIFQPVRGWVSVRSDWFGYLFQCPWCMSIWLGAAEFSLTYWLRSEEWLWWIWGGFAASYLVGLLAEKVED